MRFFLAVLMLIGAATCSAAAEPDGYPQTIDLDGQTSRQVVVDREAGQYLGHPTTCLLEDGKTILCVYPRGHGRGAIVYKRSTDGGLTWSERLPTPDSWATSQEVPTLHRVIGPDGTKRIIMWSGLYPARLAVSEDDGAHWSELKPVGDWGGIVVMGFVEALSTGKGHYLAMFHDDGRFFTKNGKRESTFKLFKTFSTDGGLTWSYPEVVFESAEVNLCEPGCIRSPDGKTMAVLLRENARRKNSHVIFSHDEGQSWSEPREVPLALTGDRHTGKYGPDGRLFISFRCISPTSKRKDRPFEGDWVGWVGTWDDIVNGGNGQYAVRLKDNTKGYDTTYPGVELLPDDTFVVTTYGHWDQGESPYILSVRFKLDELDSLAEAAQANEGGAKSVLNPVRYQGTESISQGKHLVFIASDHEYRGEETLPALARILAKHHGFDCTVLFGLDENGEIKAGASNIPGLEALRSADGMIMFTRFQALPDEQMKYIDEYLNRGGPVMGLRTSTHGFRYGKQPSKYSKYDFQSKVAGYERGFGHQVLGQTWVGHYGRNHQQSTRITVVPEQAEHPILKGVSKIHVMAGGYNAEPQDDWTILTMAQPLLSMEADGLVDASKPPMASEWTRTYTSASGKQGRVFTSLYGASEDILNDGYRRMLINATYWMLGLEDKITANLPIDFVGPYQPNTFRNGGYAHGVKPAAYLGFESPIPANHQTSAKKQDR